MGYVIAYRPKFGPGDLRPQDSEFGALGYPTSQDLLKFWFPGRIPVGAGPGLRLLTEQGV